MGIFTLIYGLATGQRGLSRSKKAEKSTFLRPNTKKAHSNPLKSTRKTLENTRKHSKTLENTRAKTPQEHLQNSQKQSKTVKNSIKTV